MKQLISTLVYLLAAVCVFGQDFSKLDTLKFRTLKDYKINEGNVVLCANYFLTHPDDEENRDRLIALKVVTNWMSGTPDYQFGIDDAIAKLMKKNDHILGVYMAAMAKFVLENPEKAGIAKDVQYNSFLLMLNFCENKDNLFPMTREVQKAIDARNKNKLAEYLNK